MKLIDVGCYNGDSTLHFASDNKYQTIEAYDPNDSFDSLWKAIENYYPHVSFHVAAVYTYDGTVPYTQRPPEAPLGSTIMQNKRDWGMGEVKEVKCFDILDLIDEECHIKLDGEGSEYDILERILDSPKSNLVKKVFIEWHGTKMSGDYEQRQLNIITMLENKGIEYGRWI